MIEKMITATDSRTLPLGPQPGAGAGVDAGGGGGVGGVSVMVGSLLPALPEVEAPGSRDS
jgi:hypothetical protein